MNWDHPSIGDVEPMPPWIQPTKTWRHLHSPSERWENLVGRELERLADSARRCGCPPRDASSPQTEFGKDCAGALRSQHDNYWRAAYGAELMATTTTCGRSVWDQRWILASARGVYLVVAPKQPAVVITAYRPHPLGLNVLWSERDFVAATRHRFEKETGMRRDTLSSLRSEPADDAGSVWRLAVAIADARELEGDPELRAALNPAEARLAALPVPLRSAALPDGGVVVDECEAAIREDDGDPTGALLGLADAVAATQILASEEAARGLVERLAVVLDWMPSAWAEYGTFAATVARTSAGAVREFWEAVGERAIAVRLQNLPSARPSQATLADRLTEPAWWQPWIDGVASLGERVARAAADTLPGWQLATAQLAGGDAVWEVVGPRPATQDPVQVFVVDHEHADGAEVTQDFQRGQAIWNLERPGQEARVLVFRGPGAAPTLREAFQAAERDRRIRVEVIDVTRPR